MSIDNQFLRNIGNSVDNSLVTIYEQTLTETEEEPQLLNNSPYMTNEIIKDTMLSKRNVFKCLSMNVQSLNAKIDQLKIMLENISENGTCFDAILLQETWLSNINDVSLLQLEGYTLISQPYRITTHGGLAMYLKDNLQYEVLDINDVLSEIYETQFLKVKLTNNSAVTIGNIYRPPRDNSDNYIQFKEQLERVLLQLNGEVIIGGDFNIDLLKIPEKPIFNEYLEMLISNGYIPKIVLPTRLTRQNGTLIDNFLCKISSEFSSVTAGILVDKISDHQPYFICLDYITLNKPSSRYIFIKNQTANTIEAFRTFLKDEKIMDKMNIGANTDPNINYNILNETLSKGLNKCMPQKIVKFNRHKHRKSKWITSGIIRSIRFRDKLYFKLKTSDINSPIYNTLEINLKTYNKILKKLIREAKKSYYDTILKKYHNDIKNTWIVIKDLINKDKKTDNFPEYIMSQGRKVTEKQEIVNSFNNYFTNIASSIATSMPTHSDSSFSDYLYNHANINFQFKHINCDDVIKIINTLKSKTSLGIDGLSTKLLKDIKHEIATPLTLIINQSLSTGIFPDPLKIGKITPIFKKDDKTQLNNYRPISVLPAISKVFEKIIANQIHHHFKSHNLYYDNQYGFRENHSTEFAALELVDRLTSELDKGKIPLNIYIDLSKAFDTVDHKILLTKLKHYGIRNTSLALLESYLSNRSQYVEIDSIKSDYQKVNIGVPQGSVLGPLLFIIYLNDIHKSSNILNFLTYADDTTLSVSLNSATNHNFNPSEEIINSELNNVCKWLNLNRLSLNISKTKCMIFSKSNRPFYKPNLKIYDTPIEYVNSFSFLGIILDNKLNWKNHINNVAKKITKAICILTKLKHYLPRRCLKTIYDSLICSHLNYGLLCWGLEPKQLIKLQKRAVRNITLSKYNSHSKPIFKKLYVLNIEDMYKRKALNFYYKLVNNTLPSYFNIIFRPVRQRDTHEHFTRIQNFKIPRVYHTFAKNCLRIYLPKLLNESASCILSKVETHSIQGFSFYIKQYFINKYQDTCQIENCYVCNT